MPQIPQLNVIIDVESSSGGWNMAVDEALLESAISNGDATLRWYRWKQPTVSLGYFQHSAELDHDPILSPLPRVRRLTGGGAILHDDELTYSLCLPPSQRLFQQPEQLYDLVHGAIASAIGQLGFPATLRGQTIKQSAEPLLCFLRQNSHDLVLSDYKILGSAQRRRRGAIMQHGSLILKASPLAQQVPGLLDLIQVGLPDNLSEVLAGFVADAVADSWVMSHLTESQREVANRINEDSVKNRRI